MQGSATFSSWGICAATRLLSMARMLLLLLSLFSCCGAVADG
jgi:hypothetical protein